MSLCLILFCSWGRTAESFEKGLGAALVSIALSGCVMSLRFCAAVNLQSSPRGFFPSCGRAAFQAAVQDGGPSVGTWKLFNHAQQHSMRGYGLGGSNAKSS